MKLVLVSLTQEETEPPLGLAYLAAYLREHADFCQTVIIDQSDPFAAVIEAKPDIVGISSLSCLFAKANRIAGEIKDRLGIPVIVGGYHISTLPQHLSTSRFDVGVMGEGEETLADLIRLYHTQGALPPEELRQRPGLVFKNESGAAEITARRPLIDPVDRIPFPARDLLDMKTLYLTPRKAAFGKVGIYASLLTSRGCPYTCTFCSPCAFWQRFRPFSAERVVDEMTMLLDTYHLDGLMIWDDLFLLPPTRLRRIVELAEERGIPSRTRFSVFCRANLINEENIALLKRLHVTSVIFGLESGSEPILRYLKKGSVTVADNYRALRLCKQNGMRTQATLIIGSPDETDEDLQRTLELIKNPDLDEALTCHLTPLPGTEVWTYALKQGVVSEAPDWDYASLDGWGFHPNLVLTRTLTREQLAAWHERLRAVCERKAWRAKLKAVNWRYVLDPRQIRKMAVGFRRYVRHGLHGFRPARKRPDSGAGPHQQGG